jgi:hypothetical protein
MRSRKKEKHESFELKETRRIEIRAKTCILFSVAKQEEPKPHKQSRKPVSEFKKGQMKIEGVAGQRGGTREEEKGGSVCGGRQKGC